MDKDKECAVLILLLKAHWCLTEKELTSPNRRFPVGQGRVSDTQNRRRNTTLPNAQQENGGKSPASILYNNKIQYAPPPYLPPFSCFWLTHTPQSNWDLTDHTKEQIANAICSFVVRPPPKIGQLKLQKREKNTSDNRLKVKVYCEIKKRVSTVFGYF